MSNIKPILRRPRVQEILGIGRQSVYNQMSQGLLTRAVKCGARAVGWPTEDIEAIRAARIAGKTDEEIRQLVRAIEVSRKAAA